VIDDVELARRSLVGFGETLAALGRCSAPATAEVRRPDALGARISTTASPWLDAVVVPYGARPPVDDPQLPHCLWSVAASAPGRVEEKSLAMPCMGLALADADLRLEHGEVEVLEPSLGVLAEVNDRAYGQTHVLGPLMGALRDERVRTHGLRENGSFVCVALTLSLGEDLSIQYVATDAEHRRRGLAGRLLSAVMADAARRGLRSATLQASPDGLPVYERLGFRRAATLRAFLRDRAG